MMQTPEIRGFLKRGCFRRQKERKSRNSGQGNSQDEGRAVIQLGSFRTYRLNAEVTEKLQVRWRVTDARGQGWGLGSFCLFLHFPELSESRS